MTFEDALLEQKAVLWPNTGADAEGQPSFGVAEEVDCRWCSNRKLMLNPKGEQIAVDAYAVVDRDVDPGSHMWLGALDDLPAGTSPGDVMEVVAFEMTPDFRNRSTFRLLGLMRTGDRMW